MQKKINHNKKEVCYPINNFSCIPKDAVEAKYNESNDRWYFKTKDDKKERTIDIVDAKNSDKYYVPEISSTYITNKFMFYFAIGIMLILSSIIILLLYSDDQISQMISIYTQSISYSSITIIVFICLLLSMIVHVYTERNYTKEY